MTILAIYAIVMLVVFVIYALPYAFGGDGLEVVGVVLSAIIAVFWPVVYVILIWDGIKLCLKKLSIIS